MSLQAEIACVKRVLINMDFQVDFIFLSMLQKMGIDASQLRPSSTTLVGFSRNKRVILKGFIILPVVFESDPSINLGVEFIVAKSLSTFHVIIRRPTLNALDVVVSIKHRKVKFSMGHQVG